MSYIWLYEVFFWIGLLKILWPSVWLGPESVDLHLNTKSEIDCVHCYDDAFFGLPLDQVRFFWPHFSGRSLEGWQLPSQNFVLQRVEFYNFAISKIFTSICHPRTKFLTPSLMISKSFFYWISALPDSFFCDAGMVILAKRVSKSIIWFISVRILSCHWEPIEMSEPSSELSAINSFIKRYITFFNASTTCV